MKKLIKLFLLGLLPFLISCNTVRFDAPMPIDGKKLESFSKDLIGKYYVTDSLFDDSTYNERYFADIYKTKDSVKTGTFTIDILKNTIRYTTIEKSYYDTKKINMDSITLAAPGVVNKAKITKKIQGDYIIIETIDTAEIINLSSKDVLKSKDGMYYVNLKNDDKDWLVAQLVPSGKGALTVNMLQADALKDLPSNFTVTKESTGSYIQDMTTGKFDYLIKHNYFMKMLKLKKY
jgi:hypothetical protein